MHMKEVTLKDGRKFFYSKRPKEVTNLLGKTVAAVQEFLIFEASEPMPKIICKLHLTDEGNWYDIDEATAVHDKSLKRLLKNAFDASGSNQVSFFQSDLNDNSNLAFQSKQY